VDQAELSNADWAATIGDFEVKDIYLFAIDSSTPDPTVYSRLFAPADNIGEDPATGSAAAALSGLLRERDISGDIMVLQGYKMGRPSQILIRIGEDKVQVGGKVTRIGQGSILVPEKTR
jgi:trans-2,3-dihydro-3-hydroxyanthranilate isomerase